MECYHGVLSFDHTCRALLRKWSSPISPVGEGTLKKIGANPFRRTWVWFQTNHFEAAGACLTASVANIPWLGSAFRGFIIGFWHEGELQRFATYTGARVEKLAISETHVDWVVSDRRHRLEIRAERAEGGLILGPTKIEMGKRVLETLNARIEAAWLENPGKLFLKALAGMQALKCITPWH